MTSVLNWPGARFFPSERGGCGSLTGSVYLSAEDAVRAYAALPSRDKEEGDILVCSLAGYPAASIPMALNVQGVR